MSIAVAPQIITPEDLLAMPDGKSYELVGGQLLERHADALSSWVGGNIFAKLSQHNRQDQFGMAWPACLGYRCFPHDRHQVRRPNASLIRNHRLPADLLSLEWITIAPDLIVDVVSSKELAVTLERRVDDYRSVQIPLIWVIYPERRTAWIYRADGSSTHLRENDELSGEQIIPGFRCPLSEIFPPRDQPATTIPVTA
jgi:Uma2 family endonuclease